MIGLLTAFVVVALREKKAREKALKELAPQPLSDESLQGVGDDMMPDEFGETDEFGGVGDDMAELDENAFR